MRVHRQRPRTAQRRRWPIALLAMLTMSIVLSACGGGSPTAAPPATTAPSTAAAISPTAGQVTPTRSGATNTPTPAGRAATTRPATTTAGRVSTAFPMKYPHLSYGMNVWLPPAADADKTLDLLTGAGFTWARQWISWASIEPSPNTYNWDTLDKVVAAAERHDTKLMLILLRAPAWAEPNGGIPKDKKAFADFAGTVAKRYKGRIAAYEIWNEQNLAAETGGKVEVAEYAQLLKVAFPAIKAADPGAVVVYGGLTPTGVNDPAIAIDDTLYLKQSYAYNNGEIKQYFDVLGAHPGGANNPPESLWPEAPGPGPGFFESRSFYFRRVEDIRKVMEEAGDGQKQVWLTEFGWTTKNAAKGYEYGQYITEQQQADYIVAAYKYANEKWPWVGVMFLWNLNFSTVSPPTDEKTPWSILYADYSPRPAYEAVKRMKK